MIMTTDKAKAIAEDIPTVETATMRQLQTVSLIQHERLMRRIETAYGRMLVVLASTVALRDEGTGGHCERVAHNATVLAKSLAHQVGETQETSDAIEMNFNGVFWSGILHDLGKIVIPETILNKPTTLTKAEWVVVKTHPDIGADLVEGIGADFSLISEGIRTHHEHWDGSGYPAGLKGRHIPFEGRCLAVADVFEAMTTQRSYHQALSEADAIEHLRNLAGTHLWSDAVDKFVSLHAEGEIYTSKLHFIPPARMRGVHAGPRVLDEGFIAQL
jgi:putative two-component system response regulator